jgi:hypothetical protein
MHAAVVVEVSLPLPCTRTLLTPGTFRVEILARGV